MAAHLRGEGKRLQRAWQCPYAGYLPSDSPPELLPSDDDLYEEREVVTETLQKIHKITGVRCTTCPKWHISQDDVVEAGDLFWFVNNKQPVKLNVLQLEAVRVMQRGVENVRQRILKRIKGK